jgi:uncharacterized membrane protein YfcA
MPTPAQRVLLVLVALAAGVVDAIGGGGGLLTVPALLAAGLPPQLALATNKGQSVFGSAMALVRFSRAGLVPWRRGRWTFPLAFAGSLLGASAVLRIDPAVLRPVVLGLLILAAAFLVFARPVEGREVVGPRALALAALLAAGVGVYDGFFGPGAGTLLVVGLASLLALSLRQASAEAKLINFGSNLAALLLFAWRGAVVWQVALPMAGAQLLGGWIGAHLTIRGGDRVVRWVVLAVVTVLVIKLGADWLRSD